MKTSDKLIYEEKVTSKRTEALFLALMAISAVMHMASERCQHGYSCGCFLRSFRLVPSSTR